MLRTLSLCGIALLLNSALVPADDKVSADAPPAEVTTPKDQLAENPNDVVALNKLIGDSLREVSSLLNSEKFDSAEKKLAETKDFLSHLEPTEEAAKRLVSRFEGYRRSYESSIELGRSSLDELKGKLEKDLENKSVFDNVSQKVAMQVGAIARSEPEKAEKLMNDTKEYLTALLEKAPDNEDLKGWVDTSIQRLERYRRTIDAAKKHLALIGTEAPSLVDNVQAWANGAELSESELQGKVVLLDFWAVWCGPCIATFPHLRDWTERYGSEDFKIVGITNYYNYTWDAEAKRAKRSDKDDPKVTPGDEQEMLKKFAAHHGLTHPFAIQSEARTLSNHFGVTGIPTAILIDRKGKVQLIRVGSGDANAHEIEEMIEKLLQE
ncbi:MAG: TlpA family protein disulfide reductase [Planctomycetaceae bacterium]|nr:TlpA family protein disulfide reductase [Planctomycetaceae bacterium]